ncbi:NUDIX domain-containing protein [Candidatus Uhrbacteria bacterium]|nr:NUDIX domain-containing protein [Candidatus Uhrbacteria bacterium]
MIPQMHVEDPLHVMRGEFLPEAVYAQAIASFIIVCTDAIILTPGHRTLALVRRQALPMRGLWCIGGRRFAGERAEASMRRCFRRETGLDLPEDRFTFLHIVEYRWKNRQQEPQGAGSHDLSYQFTVSLDPDERAHAVAHLDPNEYDRSFGIRDFTRAQLIVAGAHYGVLDWYDAVFPGHDHRP